MYILHGECFLHFSGNGWESTSTIILYIVCVKIFWINYFLAWNFSCLVSSHRWYQKIKKISHSYFSDTMNGYEKDSNRYSESELLLLMMMITIQSYIWIDFYCPSSTFTPIIDQEKTLGVESYTISTRQLRAGVLPQRKPSSYVF